MKPLLHICERVFSTLLFFLILAIYLLWPTRDFYWDGVAFAIDIEKAAQFPTPLLHPNHLIYNPLGFMIFELARLLVPSTRALFVLQGLDSLLAAASALLVYYIVRGSGAARWMAATWTLLFAFSATWWKFATDGDAYIASIFFLLCGYFALTKKQPRPLAIAGLHSVAMLFHELAALFFPAAVFLLYRKQGIRAALRYAVSAFVLTIGAYGSRIIWGRGPGRPSTSLVGSRRTRPTRNGPSISPAAPASQLSEPHACFWAANFRR